MKATIQYIENELDGLYPKTEIEGFIRLIFESVLDWNYTQQFLRKEEELENYHFREIEEIVQRLKNHEPIQYILGETEFFGIKLNVTPSVLIPRPETEELVGWIIESNTLQSPRILDIGTGSGCIPIALKKNIQHAEIFAVDISQAALEVANKNVLLNNLDVELGNVDILNWESYNWEAFNIVVSNPPYVREMEKTEMQQNVLIHEPENALYVSDHDPLLFYRKIAGLAKKHLAENGKLFFEINEYLGEHMCKLLEDMGFSSIILKKDINNRDRMISCRKKKLGKH